MRKITYKSRAIEAVILILGLILILIIHVAFLLSTFPWGKDDRCLLGLARQLIFRLLDQALDHAALERHGADHGIGIRDAFTRDVGR